jgi:hypothetical protein
MLRTDTDTEAEVRRTRESAAEETRQAWEGANRDISAARADAARARQAEVAAVTRAERAQAAAAAETARIRADHQHALDQLTTTTRAQINALEETRDSLRIRAERAEADLDVARTENRRLNEAKADPEADDTPTPRTRAATRAKKAPATGKPRLES